MSIDFKELLKSDDLDVVTDCFIQVGCCLMEFSNEDLLLTYETLLRWREKCRESDNSSLKERALLFEGLYGKLRLMIFRMEPHFHDYIKEWTLSQLTHEQMFQLEHLKDIYSNNPLCKKEWEEYMEKAKNAHGICFNTARILVGNSKNNERKCIGLVPTS